MGKDGKKLVIVEERKGWEWMGNVLFLNKKDMMGLEGIGVDWKG
jgi:hypothetical protein